MKYFFSLLSFFCACSSQPVKKGPQYSNVKLGTWTVTNQIKGDGIILVPQWHLSPQTIAQPNLILPQEANQLAIFAELSVWAQAHTFDTLLVEGCEGKIEFQTRQKINGWSIEDLQKELTEKREIDSILAPVGFKIQARYAKDIQVECGDSLKLIAAHQLALSNLRGLAGFKLRIEQVSLSQSVRNEYLTGAKEVLHLPKETSEVQVLSILNSELKKAILEFEHRTHQRNETFISNALTLKGIKVVVIGAIHVADFQTQLLQKNIPFSIWTPIGLNNDDAPLVEKLKAKLSLGESL